MRKVVMLAANRIAYDHALREKNVDPRSVAYVASPKDLMGLVADTVVYRLDGYSQNRGYGPLESMWAFVNERFPDSRRWPEGLGELVAAGVVLLRPTERPFVKFDGLLPQRGDGYLSRPRGVHELRAATHGGWYYASTLVPGPPTAQTGPEGGKSVNESIIERLKGWIAWAGREFAHLTGPEREDKIVEVLVSAADSGDNFIPVLGAWLDYPAVAGHKRELYAVIVRAGLRRVWGLLKIEAQLKAESDEGVRAELEPEVPAPPSVGEPQPNTAEPDQN